MGLHVIDEAKRCLNCKKPRCQEGCPIHTPIPVMIQMLLQGEMPEAAEMVFANNPLSVICSLVCDHEKQCEGHCVKGTLKIIDKYRETIKGIIEAKQEEKKCS